MSARVIVSGAVGKPAEIRTSKNGNTFATFSVRESVNGSTRWWQAIAFNESVIEAVKELSVGEGLAVAGEITAEIYAPAGGESRINWRVTVDGALSARKPEAKDKRDGKSVDDAPKSIRAARTTPADGKAHADRSWAAPQTGGDAPLDDSIPFAPEWR